MMKQKLPIVAVTDDAPKRIMIPSANWASNDRCRRICAGGELIEKTSMSYNTFYVPVRCRWKLFDRNGNLIFTSRTVRLGDDIPEIRALLTDGRSYCTRQAWTEYRPWHLKVDRDRLVPAHLRSRAVRAVVSLTPDVPELSAMSELSEIKTLTYDLTPTEPQFIISYKTDTQRAVRRAKRLNRIRRRLPALLPYSRKNRNFADNMKQRPQNRDFTSIIEDTIRRHRLLDPGDKVIVALSGGADSVALLSALVNLGYDCMAAHCNFHLRGEESQRDMHHAEAVCSRLGVDLAVKDFDVARHKAATGESVEMACRTLRYEWFDALLTRERARAVAVGHHREDQIETVMLNLFRGTGIAGLCGMRYRRDYIIRPMLDCSRAEIEEYLAREGLDYITDSSNLSDDHLRNRIRNRIMPLVGQLFPGAENAILTTASNLDDARRIYNEKVDDYRRAYVRADGSIHVALMAREIPDKAVAVLRELLRSTGLTASQCRDIIASASGSGLHFDSGGVTVAELDRGILTLCHPEKIRTADAYDIDLSRDVIMPVNLRISRHHISEFSPERDPSVIYLDESALLTDRGWTLRRPRKGDRMHPFGMSGSKLLSDLYSDAGYSAADKRHAWVLTCGDRIVWAVGLRASSIFPITPDTHNYLKIKYKP